MLEEGVWGRNLSKVSPTLARPNLHTKISQGLANPSKTSHNR